MNLRAAAGFCHRLSTGHRAGLDFVTLLESEAGQGPGHQREMMRQLAEGAKRGHQLHELMAERAPYFPHLVTTMIAVGEETGKLERSLLILRQHIEERLETKKQFMKSMIAPAIQLFGAIGVLSLLILVMGILGDRIPDMLGFGLRGSEGVMWFWGYLTVFFGLIALAVHAVSRNWLGLHNIAPLFYLIPKIGPAIQTITIARFCHTLALSLEAGLEPIRGIKLGLDSTGSQYYEAVASDAETAIRQGATMAGGMEATGIFPDEFIRRVDIAEISGTDAEAMNILAKEYDERAQAAVKLMAAAATMLIRLIVVGVVIFFVFRLFSFYFNALQGASEPIIPRRGN